MSMTREAAETLALQCLGWLAGQEDLIGVFLGASGASTEDLRTQAQDPEFLGSVLDFVLMDDTWVVQFCDAAGLSYHLPMTARAMLPGGQQVHWT
ncbi:DUF3572 domain-containing protein [Pseudooceanicola sp. 502str34]|uniref:DUF3572 domain-containing protein n=1 Tax=Maritimibacter alkaliphilus TaxID=404236 RepID=UPI001C94DE20|nr:DUF3572 domain-containing protein [Maritimibacter alkaliphilus]MBY6089100.1 DUF3572 domain-containing protein [Maritimibacter alkaliphilus]